MTIGNLLFAYNWSDAGAGSTSGVDKSGNGRDFAFTGTTGRTAAGSGYTYGGARPNAKGLIQGTTEIQVGPAVAGLNPTSWTLIFWAKAAMVAPSWMWEWYWLANDTGARGLLFLSSVLRFRLKNSSNTAFDGGSLTPDGTNFHCWAVTHDGTTLRSYRDTAGTMAEIGSGVAAAFTPATATAIRVFDGTGSSAVVGDTRCYDSVLTLAELQTMSATPVDDPVTTTGPPPYNRKRRMQPLIVR